MPHAARGSSRGGAGFTFPRDAPAEGAAGDKVMQVENDYEREVYNGDLGFIRRIDPEQGDVVVDFEGREVAYDVGELDAVVPAYAITVPKAQGSEYPAVVVPLVTQHWSMLRRNLVYTAVTRGRRLVVVVGQLKVLAIAVRGTQTRRRWSKLGEWLGGEPERALWRRYRVPASRINPAASARPMRRKEYGGTGAERAAAHHRRDPVIVQTPGGVQANIGQVRNRSRSTPAASNR